MKIPEVTFDLASGTDTLAGPRFVWSLVHGNLAIGWIPAIAQPVVEVRTNRNFFGNEIIPAYMQSWLPEQQFFPRSTPEPYRAAGRLFGVSPLHVQTFVRGWTGHLGNAVVTGLDESLWDTQRNGPKPFPRTVGLITGLASLQPPPLRTFSRYSNEFYEISDWFSAYARTVPDRHPARKDPHEHQPHQAIGGRGAPYRRSHPCRAGAEPPGEGTATGHLVPQHRRPVREGLAVDAGAVRAVVMNGTAAVTMQGCAPADGPLTLLMPSQSMVAPDLVDATAETPFVPSDFDYHAQIQSHAEHDARNPCAAISTIINWAKLLEERTAKQRTPEQTTRRASHPSMPSLFPTPLGFPMQFLQFAHSCFYMLPPRSPFRMLARPFGSFPPRAIGSTTRPMPRRACLM